MQSFVFTPLSSTCCTTRLLNRRALSPDLQLTVLTFFTVWLNHNAIRLFFLFSVCVPPSLVEPRLWSTPFRPSHSISFHVPVFSNKPICVQKLDSLFFHSFTTFKKNMFRHTHINFFIIVRRSSYVFVLKGIGFFQFSECVSCLYQYTPVLPKKNLQSTVLSASLLFNSPLCVRFYPSILRGAAVRLKNRCV